MHLVPLYVDSVHMESHWAMIKLRGNEIPHQLSHCQMKKKIGYVEEFKTEIENTQKLFFGLHRFDLCKRSEQKSHASVHVPLGS